MFPNDLDPRGVANYYSLNKGFDQNDPDEEPNVKSDMEYCLDDINIWMSNNRLKMNSVKTKLICFRSQQQLAECE